MMPKITFAAPVDPDANGVGYFESALESVDREKRLLEFFGFLELPLVGVHTFISDYLIHFKRGSLVVDVMNDDCGYEEFGPYPEETVYFVVESDSEVELMEVQKKLEKNIRVVKLS
ncbi:hypothetical protein ACXN5S_11010 [Pseudoroseicyclus sp. H15]